MARRVAVPILVVLASATLMLALVAAYADRALFNSDQFANRATDALTDDSVRSLVADKVTDQIILKHEGDLIAARPILQSVTSSVVASRAFTGLFRSGVRDVHRALFDRDQHTLTLTVVDIGTIVSAALAVVKPNLADRVEPTRQVDLVSRDIGNASATAVRAADTVHVLGLLLFLLALLTAAGALFLSSDRRRTAVRLGIGAAIGGVLIVIGLAIGRSTVTGLEDTPETRAAVGAIWDAFLGDLHTAGWILAASGAVVAAAGASLIRPVSIDAPLRRAGGWITAEPSQPWLKALRGVALIVVGLIFVLNPSAVLEAAVTLAGLYLVYAGVTAILWLVYQPGPKRAQTAAGPARRRRTAVATAVAAVLIVGAVSVFVGSGGTSTAAPTAGACNGHDGLCERPFNEVTLAATHNAMSVPLPGWYSAEQDRPIPDQLSDGIRGLLIDTHYADRLENGRLRTFFGDRDDLQRQAKEDGVSADAVDAALRLRERLGFSGEGERGMYLCHTFCELGGTALGEILDDIHDFLVANPGEVLVVINQDYVTPEDFVGAVKDAKLDDFAYKGPTDGQWPTLREMIDDNERVIFLAENHAGAAPWYHLAYDAITEETPYTFSSPKQLTERAGLAKTCRPNRGPDDAPLFLVNHWVSTDPFPQPSHAAKVNAYDPLMQRLDECEQVRGHLPNLVAVNFYRRGDVFRAVDTLNGLD